MKRNIIKTMEQGQKIIQKNERYDLYLSEIEELLKYSYQKEKNSVSLFRIASAAFLTGVAIGFRIRAKKQSHS